MYFNGKIPVDPVYLNVKDDRELVAQERDVGVRDRIDCTEQQIDCKTVILFFILILLLLGLLLLLS
jgi:hypothetical protein